MTRRLGPLVLLALIASLVAPIGAAAQDGEVQLRAAVADTPAPRPALQFHGSGWGHSVGMSQYGAYAQALSGRDFRAILGTYYPGTALEDRAASVSDLPVKVGLFQDLVSSTPIIARDGPLYWYVCDPECTALQDAAGANVTQQPDETVYVGNVVPAEDPTPQGDTSGEPAGEPTDGQADSTSTAPDEFGIKRGDGSTIRITFTSSSPKLRVKTPDGGTSWFQGHHPMKTSSTDPFASYRDGYHDFHVTPATDTSPAKFTVVHTVKSLERYLRGLAEVPTSWGEKGPAALEAQIVAARTYALGRMGGISSGCMCNLLATPANQVWIGGRHDTSPYRQLWYDAIDATKGVVATHDSRLISTFYSSSHGGRTEAVEDSWAYGTTAIPYLTSVDDPWSLMTEVNGTKVGNPNAAWTAAVSNGAFASYVGGFDIVTRVLTRSRTRGGSPAEVLVEGLDSAGERISKTFTRPSSGRKSIAGANFKLDLKTTDGQKLKSQQLRRFGFAPFTDDDGNAHEYSIVFVTTAGIANGKTATEFDPTGTVRRGQMATFLYQMLDLPPGETTFSDVPEDHTHAEAISAVADAGIAQGYEDGTFRPEERVTRSQMASFLAAALDLAPGQDDGRFEDVADGVHRPAIYAVADAEITLGCEAGKYCPLDTVTRGQMASFLHRAVEHARSSS